MHMKKAKIEWEGSDLYAERRCNRPFLGI